MPEPIITRDTTEYTCEFMGKTRRVIETVTTDWGDKIGKATVRLFAPPDESPEAKKAALDRLDTVCRKFGYRLVR